MYVTVNLTHCTLKHCDLNPCEVLFCRVMTRSVSIGIQSRHWRSVECWCANSRVPVTPEIQCVFARVLKEKPKWNFSLSDQINQWESKRKELNEGNQLLSFTAVQFWWNSLTHSSTQSSAATVYTGWQCYFALDLIFIKQVLMND